MHPLLWWSVLKLLMTRISRFLLMLAAISPMQAGSPKQLGVVPKGNIHLQAATDSKYHVGDIWEYKTRNGEEHSTFVIVKVESSSNVGLIVHIS